MHFLVALDFCFYVLMPDMLYGCKNCGNLAVKKWRENEKINRKWGENEEMERDSLSTYPHFLFISPSLSISHIKNCLILSQNVKYGTLVAMSQKTCAMRKKSGSNSLRKAPQVLSLTLAGWVGLIWFDLVVFCLVGCF